MDLRKNLYSNVVLSGGSTLCRGKLSCVYFLAGADLCNVWLGFGDRLLNEIRRLALKDVKIKIYAPPERKYSTWIGGSILAGLNAFKKVRLRWLFAGALVSYFGLLIKMWVSAEEYQEDPDIIHKKTGF